MFNIEGHIYDADPFVGCPKMGSISNTGTKALDKTLSCCHVNGFNASLGPYVRCIECNLEEDPTTKNQSTTYNFQNEYIDLYTARSAGCPSLEGVIEYLTNFLGKPHKELEAVGHKGSVCPFTPKVLVDKTVYFSQEEVNIEDPSEQDRLKQRLTIFHLPQFFTKVEKSVLPENLKTACSLIIVNGPQDAKQCDYFVSQVQKQVQPIFVKSGLLLSELHPFSPVPSVRNQNFFPSRPPVPIFFIRRIIPNDIPYLIRKDRYEEVTYSEILHALDQQFGRDIVIAQMERLGKSL